MFSSTEPNEDALVILCNGKIPSQQFAELKSILINPFRINDESLKQKFYTGKLRIGRSQNNLYWEECSKIFSETPKKIENIQKQIKEFKLTIEAKRKEINNLENQKRKLNAEVNNLTNQLNKNIESLKGLEMVTDSLQETTTKVSNIEKMLVKDMQTQLEIDENQFSSLNEKSKFPKLSLIFNAMGLSSETICILQDYTGAKFNDDDLNDSTKYYGIHDFKEQKELFYIRHMMQKKLISTDHVENCAVCICKTPLDLKNLLLEREIDVPIDFSFVDDFQLNGPRFLFINYSDCKRFRLNGEQIEQLMELKEQLHSLHLYDEIRWKPKNKVHKLANKDKPPANLRDVFEESMDDIFGFKKPTPQKPKSNTNFDIDFDDIFSGTPGGEAEKNKPNAYDEIFGGFDFAVEINEPEPEPELSNKEINTLIEMGFNEADVIEALKKHMFFDNALTALLNPGNPF